MDIDFFCLWWSYINFVVQRHVLLEFVCYQTKEKTCPLMLHGILEPQYWVTNLVELDLFNATSHSEFETSIEEAHSLLNTLQPWIQKDMWLLWSERLHKSMYFDSSDLIVEFWILLIRKAIELMSLLSSCIGTTTF